MNLNRVRRDRQALLRLGLVAAMVLCLAFTAQYFLSFLATSPAIDQQSYRILAREFEKSPNVESELRLDDLVVDGRRLRFDTTESSSHWTGPDKRGHVHYDGGPEPGSVTFAGAGFLMVANAQNWSGIVEVQREDGDARLIEVQASAGREQAIVVEDPPAPASRLVLIAALLMFSVAAWSFAPWRSDRRVDAWLACFLIAFHTLFWATQCVATKNDSGAYLNNVSSLIKGSPAYYPPGYPAFLGFIKLFSAENLGRWIALVQHVLAVLTALWTYSLARRLAPLELALLAGILAGTLSPISAMSQTVMSEIPTMFAMVGALYFGLRAAETGKYRFAVLAGVLTGWGGLLRAVPLAALLPATALLLWYSPACRKIRLGAITLAAAGAVLLLPVAWFTYMTGKPMLATSAGRHLYNRLVFEQKQLDESGPATKILLTMLEGKDPRQFTHSDLNKQPGYKQLAKAQDFNQLLLCVSREALLKDPVAYLLYTPRLAWRELLVGAGDYICSWGSTKTLDTRLESPPPLRLTASSLRWRWRFDEVYRLVWPLLCWGAIIGGLLGLPLSQRGLVLALVCVPVVYLLSNASLELFTTRYTMPTIPFMVVLSIVSIRFLLAGWTAIAHMPPTEVNADTAGAEGQGLPLTAEAIAGMRTEAGFEKAHCGMKIQ